mmetsp:Transcript_16626/g.25348  ORF Transcript_16626/g.25348 Transcript_16626/m.25348 type:complete len:518 (-) Transcript_16626:22-1575(-)
MRLFRTDRRGNPIPWFQRKRPARRHPHLPKIFYLVKNQHWALALQRARSHPHEICVQEDISGDTALHIACRLNPPANLIQAMREACSITNSEGSIPIHVAATHRCSPEAIQMLLQEGEDKGFHPAAALTRMGRAPIHYACFSHRGLSLPAFQILVEATLKTGSYQRISTDVDYDLEDLMEDDEYSQFGVDEADEGENTTKDTNNMIDNVVTLRDATGQTPLGLLFRRYRERVRIVIQDMDKSHPLAVALRVQRDLGELWEKARWIVARLTQEQVKPCNTLLSTAILGNYCEVPESPAEQAIAQEAAKWAYERFFQTPCTPSSTKSDMPSKRAFRVVHASVGLTGFGCPPEMIRLALSIHPNQVREMDEDGNLPIHICSMAPSLVFNRNDDDSSFLSEFSLFSTATSSSRPPPPNAFEKVFKILLQRYPAAVRVPHGITGKLPLALAFDGRTWEDGIQTLLDAYPAALESKKLPTMGIYPYVLERIGYSASPLKRMQRKGRTAIFELLRAKPDLVKRE